MEQKERETSLRELLGALMATCAGESNELVILAGGQPYSHKHLYGRRVE